MKYLFFISLFFQFGFTYTQVVEISFESKSSFSSSFIDKINDLPESQKQELSKDFSGLVKYYTVVSDGDIIITDLDSISQRCGLEPIYLFPYKQIFVKNKDVWQKYFQKKEDLQSTYYTQTSDIIIPNWNIDYNSSKNILGHQCYYAEKENDKNEWAWFTIDIPILLSPQSILPLPGLVLEYKKESDHYSATNIKFDENNTLELDGLADENKVIPVDDFLQFANILMSDGVKMSSDMFRCRDF